LAYEDSLTGYYKAQFIKKYGFGEQIRLFLQQMRDYRNRISYEGFIVHKNYVVLNMDKIEEIIGKLFGLI
jgi:hypothetical protein